MKYGQQYEDIDPDVQSDGTFKDETDDPDAPNDAFVIGEHMESIRSPDASALGNDQSGAKPWTKPAAAVLGLLCVALTVWNLSRLAQGPPPPPKPSPVQVKQALYLGVMKVDAYRRVYGVVPDTLEEAGLPEAGPYSYLRIDQNHYVLSFESHGEKLEYSSSVSKEHFFGSPKDLLSMGDTK